METVVQPAAHAYAAVSAPLPPQRHASIAAPASGPRTQPVPPPKIAVPPPALDAGRANARAAGQKPLAVPPVVAARPADAGRAPAGQDFAGQKYMPSLGFSGSFVREIDASGGFTRLGR